MPSFPVPTLLMVLGAAGCTAGEVLPEDTAPPPEIPDRTLTSSSSAEPPFDPLAGRISFPIGYCATQAFAALLPAEETRAVLDIWDDLDERALFVDMGDCATANRAGLELVFNPEGEGFVTTLRLGDRTRLVATPDVISLRDAADCETSQILERALAHHVGHVVGIPHSCEVGQPCTEPAAREALMYWAQSACDPRLELSSWDIAAFDYILTL